MSTKQQIAEAFLKAHESASFLRSNLLEANVPTATEEPYLHHILLSLLDRVADLQGELQRLRHLTQTAADNEVHGK